jgi:hypothetical protein
LNIEQKYAPWMDNLHSRLAVTRQIEAPTIAGRLHATFFYFLWCRWTSLLLLIVQAEVDEKDVLSTLITGLGDPFRLRLARRKWQRIDPQPNNDELFFFFFLGADSRSLPASDQSCPSQFFERPPLIHPKHFSTERPSPSRILYGFMSIRDIYIDDIHVSIQL